MTGRQCHIVHLRGVPGADNQATRIGICFDLLDQLGDLVDTAAIRCRPGAPLRPINRPEIAIFIGPFIPDTHAIFLEIADVGIARQKPQKFMNDGFHMQFLGGEDGKALRQIETHLMAENTVSADAGAV